MTRRGHIQENIEAKPAAIKKMERRPFAARIDDQRVRGAPWFLFSESAVVVV